LLAEQILNISFSIDNYINYRISGKRMDYRDLMPRFDVKNSNLSLLISEAAVDIDNYIKGRSQEDKSVKYLSRLLNDITQGKNPRALSPNISYVLGFAIPGEGGFFDFWNGKKYENIALQTNLAAKDLRDFKSLSRDRQEELRDFCIRLSQEVMSYRKECYSGPKRHLTETHQPIGHSYIRTI